MLQRRRFFPATPVQHVPGKTVALELQLKRGEKAQVQAPQASGAGEVFGVGWLTPTLEEDNWTFTSTQLEDGRYRIVDAFGSGLEDSIWEGVPVSTGEWVARPISGPGFHCTELQVDTSYFLYWPGLTYFGVIEGSGLSDARWEFEWDFPSEADPAVSRRGHLAVAYGNILQIRATPTDGSMDEIDTLTARAFSGGSQVGQLIFRGHAHGF